MSIGLNYLQNNNGSISFANAHIIKMMQDNDYLLFDHNHSQTGDGSKMWWEDEAWLESIDYVMNETAFNFYSEITNPPGAKPTEYADKCTGIKDMVLLSKGDKKERAGFLTQDDKFIYTEIGTGTNVPLSNVIKKGSVTYYSYPASLGAPTYSYLNMYLDPITNRYMIPIRSSIHTHIPFGGVNGVSITVNSTKSREDRRGANILQRNNNGIFNLYVIEVKDNGKYLTASFLYNQTNYSTIGNDLILADICNGLVN